MRNGLVLEGGAMRGLFSAGVLDVLMENGITFDGVVGVSAGAAFGSNFKSGQIGRALRYNLRFCKEPRYCSLRSLFKTGDLYGAEFCYRTLPLKLDVFDSAVFAANPTEFYVVCTDVHTGAAVYQKLQNGDETDMDWMRASASMPMVSRPVQIGKQTLLDGGIADSVPLRFFEQTGFVRNLVVLTQPLSYRKEKSRLSCMLGLFLRKYPKTAQAMKGRHIRYNESLDYVRQAEMAGRALVLRPKEKLPVGRVEHDAVRLQQAYDLGREAALERLEEIKSFLRKDEV